MRGSSLTNLGAVDSEGASVRALQPALAEGQGAECLVDVGQELLGPRQAEWHMGCVEVLHIMRTLHILRDETETHIWIYGYEIWN